MSAAKYEASAAAAVRLLRSRLRTEPAAALELALGEMVTWARAGNQDLQLALSGYFLAQAAKSLATRRDAAIGTPEKRDAQLDLEGIRDLITALNNIGHNKQFDGRPPSVPVDHGDPPHIEAA